MQARYSQSKRKRKLATDLLLNAENAVVQNAIEQLHGLLPTVPVRRRAQPYPPPNHWIVENQATWDLWHHQITSARQPDARIPRKPMFMLDESQLSYDLEGGGSAIFVDADDGSKVAVVISELCNCPKILHWVNQIVLVNVALEKNVRVRQSPPMFKPGFLKHLTLQKEDAGSLVISGWSAGSRSRLLLDFARNFEAKHKLSSTQKEKVQYKASSAFALFWNLVKSLGPQEVVDDLEDFVKKHNLYKMDPAVLRGGRIRTYTVDVDGEVPIIFRNADLAPPSGVFARNYARYVHREKQPHRWAASWTTFRDDSANDAGGHFYLPEYGIRIRAATNKAVFWRPGDWHATSLPKLAPDEKNGPLLQCGLAIVTSARLPAAFRAFHEGRSSTMELNVDTDEGNESDLEDRFEGMAL
ncbi:hypothetical protein BDP27DRAFT_1214783 [Rhodocollybia butyracea]|uniref:Uncharacterized protein n=1 Tax=Rhodocollybia butyracea TaxID=206335 RepID=A0A9P5UBL1_9AGAR|nr:hypothetical protein BDP27DRAFT_1214783 [Rhodocollybia butyracea]